MTLRQACFRAYHSGLIAAVAILDIPIPQLDADCCDEPSGHVAGARYLRSERHVEIDVEPYLLELRDGGPSEDSRLLLNLDAFLDEVALLLEKRVQLGIRAGSVIPF